MTIDISIVAILISIISLAFSFQQHINVKNIKQNRKHAKCNSIIRKINELRKSAQHFQSNAYLTVVIDDYKPFLDKLNTSTDDMLNTLHNNDDVSLSEIYIIEKKFLEIDLAFNLLTTKKIVDF